MRHEKTPSILLIGDSISIGYTEPVTRLLEGKADVCRIPGNGQFTEFGLQNISEWLGSEKWDVIHFNWGIWDMHRINGGPIRSTTDQYASNLRELVGILKATGARLIWATTTPLGIPSEGAGNIAINPEDVPVYNEAALKVMQENRVAIDDLYSAALPKADELHSSDNRHFTPEGYGFLAHRVVKSIKDVLGRSTD